jgi:hypothetical protein
MLRRALALAVVLVSAACSSSPETTGGTGGAPSASASAKYSFAFITAPGQETHWCQYVKLPKGDGAEVLVTGYQWSWADMHHWALYRTTSDLPADVSFDQPFDCFAPGGMKYAEPASLVLAGGATGDQTFPAGAGFGFKSEEVVIVQAHTLNTTMAETHPTLDVTLALGDAASVKNRVGLIQFYDPYIVVPAHTEAKAQMRCGVPQDMTVLFATTHEHTRGTGVQVFLDGPDGTAGAAPIVETKDWQHPTVSKDVLQVKAGSHFRTVCNYLGDDHDVIQGQDKQDNEMCMFIGYYYPVVAAEKGGVAFENCIQTPIPGGVGDGYGTGVKTCSESLACIQACPPGDAPSPGDGRIDVGKCWQTCLVDSCTAASAPLNDLGYCVQTKCATACAPGGDCPTCVVSNCASQYGACQGGGC